MNKKINILTIFLCITLVLCLIIPAFVSTDALEIEYEDIDTSTDAPIVTVDENGEFPDFENGISTLIASTTLLESSKNFQIKSTGQIVVRTYNVKQNVASTVTVDNNEMIVCEDITKATNSMGKTISHNLFYSRNAEIVKFRETSNVSDSLVASYSESLKSLSKADYKQIYGYIPGTDDPYILSPQTVLSEKDFVHNEDGYSFTINFIPSKAARNYKTKVGEMSGTGNIPSFQKMQYVVKIDNNGKIISLQANETYVLKYNALITVTIDSTLTKQYTYFSEPVVAELPSDF